MYENNENVGNQNYYGIIRSYNNNITYTNVLIKNITIVLHIINNSNKS